MNIGIISVCQKIKVSRCFEVLCMNLENDIGGALEIVSSGMTKLLFNKEMMKSVKN